MPDALTFPGIIAAVTLSATVAASADDAASSSVAAEWAVMQSDATVLASVLVGAPGGGSPTLSIYGFSDFTVTRAFLARDDAFRELIETPTAFYIGNLNLYLENTFGAFRSLIEVRFLYEPNGATGALGQGFVRTTVPDHADLFRRTRVGGIEIERAWVEYAFNPKFVLRVGQWLTPYGIWNVDHGSPTIIAVRRPYTIGNELFPERQTGFQLHGVTALGAADLSYSLTLSNGRGPFDAYIDLDDNKAIGVRVAIQDYSFGDLCWGVSAYYGRFTDIERSTEIRDDPIFVTTRAITNQYDEISLATDLRLQVDGLLVQVEIIANSRFYTQEGRPRVALSERNALVADDWVLGAYVLIGFETPWWGIMPYIVVEKIDEFTNPLGIDGATALYAGLNWRIHPRFTIKLQGTFIGFEGDTSFGRSRLPSLDAQVAWAF